MMVLRRWYTVKYYPGDPESDVYKRQEWQSPTDFTPEYLPSQPAS